MTNWGLELITRMRDEKEDKQQDIVRYWIYVCNHMENRKSVFDPNMGRSGVIGEDRIQPINASLLRSMEVIL